MTRITQDKAVASLPKEELESILSEFLEPVLTQLSEQRLQEAGMLAVRSILAAQSPIIYHYREGTG